jgi:hypothetical protein
MARPMSEAFSKCAGFAVMTERRSKEDRHAPRGVHASVCRSDEMAIPLNPGPQSGTASTTTRAQ